MIGDTAVRQDRDGMRTEIDFRGYRPPEGYVRVLNTGERMTFQGWLGLLALLEELADEELNKEHGWE
jgi:hypothetical protein